jgi:TPR repeat protein
MLAQGEGILMNKSHAVHYFKSSADQGNAVAQFNYSIMLSQGEGILMNKSHAVHYFKLSADQGNAGSQFCYRIMLDQGEVYLYDVMATAFTREHPALASLSRRLLTIITSALPDVTAGDMDDSATARCNETCAYLKSYLPIFAASVRLSQEIAGDADGSEIAAEAGKFFFFFF